MLYTHTHTYVRATLQPALWHRPALCQLQQVIKGYYKERLNGNLATPLPSASVIQRSFFGKDLTTPVLGHAERLPQEGDERKY